MTAAAVAGTASSAAAGESPEPEAAGGTARPASEVAADGTARPSWVVAAVAAGTGAYDPFRGASGTPCPSPFHGTAPPGGTCHSHPFRPGPVNLGVGSRCSSRGHQNADPQVEQPGPACALSSCRRTPER